MGFLKVIQIFSIISLFLVDGVYNLEEGSSYFFYQRPVYPRDCQEVLEQCTTQSVSGVYLIRPDGYDEAFEVYCDHQVDGGGWTVLLRRNDNNSAEFRRTFSEYSEGFGFLGSEFWLGNRRLSFLTNQKRYELRIDMVNSAGSSFYITYDLFRISDEWSNYKLISTGQYNGSADNFITQCPSTISPSGDCASPVPSQPTDCYDIFTSGITEDGVYTIQPTGWTESPFDVYCNMSHDGGWTVFQRRVNGSVDFQFREWEAYKEGFGFPSHELWLGNEKLFLLTNQKNYKLRVDYVDRDGVPYYMNYDLFRVGNETTNYQLELLGAFTGNSDNFITQCATISPSGDCATDCYDIFTSGITEDGVYTIQPTGWTESPFDVYCNMSHDGGWTVFQRRVNGSVDFQFREWEDYKEGFGLPSHELWLGNEKIFLLTNQKNYKLRVDYVDRDGVPFYMNYDIFRVGNETTNYQLELLGAFTGNSGYDYMAYHRGRPFTTRDRDNDAYSDNCAVYRRGGWWYSSCYTANLNGDYSDSGYSGVALNLYYNTRTYSLRYTQMKIRPV
ncbi:Fibrinogen C domain-containing protein 1-B [Holothuria leucospilota]|uniref:Fibrinogen C domain-containing protein 1-B n=1 Tax=Holothuria leucospilota TaxID=206669 RepID=A0A9Q1BCY3_HOLLE|nr:Fibrinogen C domain-containing protein 1-B [Holothuria leucospilota]